MDRRFTIPAIATAVGLAILISLPGKAINVAASNAKETPQESHSTPKPKTLRLKDLPPILQQIAYCESGGRQFDETGQVITGAANVLDKGVFQINLRYHSQRAKQLGYDLLSEDGNIRYALWLYEREGTVPWNWSRPCWNPARD